MTSDPHCTWTQTPWARMTYKTTCNRRRILWTSKRDGTACEDCGKTVRLVESINA